MNNVKLDHWEIFLLGKTKISLFIYSLLFAQALKDSASTHESSVYTFRSLFLLGGLSHLAEIRKIKMQLANPENFKQFVQIKDNSTVTTSEIVAKVFGKRHDNVIRDIRAILQECDEDFAKLNFEVCFKINKLQNGKPTPYYNLTKNGFMLLVMGYKSKKAMKMKIAYIQAFDYMADELAKGAAGLLEQYYQLLGEHNAEKQFASLCGKGLNQWKEKKPLIEATLRLFEDKMQIELPLLNKL
ncbi:Rha family transcriptional regulator [Avibacterium paragallinarum]|nr:Rha family transcriptional regulator [Avibacterium paragallinarum]WAL56107.1 Rha family transcriptional regulator [Avibacterium paragallinarum]WAM58654.1 Rha family transcriptional regulator [Avibacterium paragallinarum]